jgi:hypothetical protein
LAAAVKDNARGQPDCQHESGRPVGGSFRDCRNRLRVDFACWHRAVFIWLVRVMNWFHRRKQQRLFGKRVAAVKIIAPPLFVLGHWRRPGGELFKRGVTMSQTDPGPRGLPRLENLGDAVDPTIQPCPADAPALLTLTSGRTGQPTAAARSARNGRGRVSG